jgi:hypothetical protein
MSKVKVDENKHDDERQAAGQAYEPPHAEDLDTSAGPSVTVPGVIPTGD